MLIIRKVKRINTVYLVTLSISFTKLTPPTPRPETHQPSDLTRELHPFSQSLLLSVHHQLPISWGQDYVLR